MARGEYAGSALRIGRDAMARCAYADGSAVRRRAGADLASSIEWYNRLFGRAADIVPNDREVMWRVTDGGWLYGIQDADRAGNSLVTLSVTDLESAVAELAARSVGVGLIEPVGDAGRKATAEDPDGNSIALIEVAK